MTLEDTAVFSGSDPSISPGPQAFSYTHTQMLFSKLAGKAAATEKGTFLYQHSALAPRPGPPHSCFHISPAPKWKIISQHWNVNAFTKSDAESEENSTEDKHQEKVFQWEALFFLPLIDQRSLSKNTISLVTTLIQKGYTKLLVFPPIIFTFTSFDIHHLALP